MIRVPGLMLAGAATAMLLGACSTSDSDTAAAPPPASSSATEPTVPAEASADADQVLMGRYVDALASGGGGATQYAKKGSAAWLYALADDEAPTGTAIKADDGASWQLSYADDEAGVQRVLSQPVIKSGEVVDVQRNGVPVSDLVAAGDDRWYAGTEYGATGDLRFRIDKFSNFGEGLWVQVTVKNEGKDPGTLLLEKFVTGGKGYGDTTFLNEDVYPDTTVTASLFIPEAPAKAGKLHFTLFADGGEVGSFTIDAPAVGA